MAEGSPKDGSRESAKEPDSSGHEGGLWSGLKSLLFGEEEAHSLRKELEEALDEYDGDEEGERSAPPAKGDLSAIERQMVRNLLHFSERTVDDVALPRADIVAIEEKASFEELAALFAEAGHSRVPVYRETLDTIVGMVHIRDAFAVLAGKIPVPDSIAPLIRQPLYVPESMGALDLLAEMRAKRTHLAIVLDEYSGTEGLLTFEDLVEEIVGEVEDEHDDAPEAMLIPLDGGLWEADARAELDDVAEEIDEKLGDVEEDVDTLGGLAFVIAGRVPEPGEILEHEESGWKLEILDSDGRRVTRLRLHPPVAREDGGEE